MEKQNLCGRLDYMWRNGYIDKQSVPFIKTAINRPAWAAWNFFFRRAFTEADFQHIKSGFSFLKYRYRGQALSFLHEYFPGLGMIEYFAAAWHEQEKSMEKDKTRIEMSDQLRFSKLLDKTVNL